MLAERGIYGSYGLAYAKRLTRSHPFADVRRHLDEIFISLNGQEIYLWRAIDCEGQALNVLVQSRRNKKAALKLLRKLLKAQGFVLANVVTHKLPSYRAAFEALGMKRKHITDGRSNNPAENSHLPIRPRERRM